MSNHGDERSGRVHRTSLFSRRGVRHRENEEPETETLTEDPYIVRVADLVRSMDSNSADRKTDAEQADAEQADAEQADAWQAGADQADAWQAGAEQAGADQAYADQAYVEAAGTAHAVELPEPAEVAAEAALAEAAVEGADSVTVGDKAATKDDGPDAAKVVGDADEARVDSAARVLNLAQKLHDEYVAEGQSARDRLIREGQARHDELVAAGEAERRARIAEAEASVVEAQQKKAAALQGLGVERRLLQEEIEELRSFEGDYRAELRSYLEGQLTELGQTGVHRTRSQSSPEATQPEATQQEATQPEAT